MTAPENAPDERESRKLVKNVKIIKKRGGGGGGKSQSTKEGDYHTQTSQFTSSVV